MKQSYKNNVVLIGFMGSGKTTVGLRLAERLTYHFYDSDQVLENRMSDTINHIFATHGEAYFRDKETALLQEFVTTLEHSVLSTGGGLPLREQNAKLIKEIGYVVYLKASKETTIRRLQGDTTRPLLQGEGLEQKVDKLLTTRTPIYEKAAHKIIATDDRTVDEIVSLIMEAYLKQIY